MKKALIVAMIALLLSSVIIVAQETQQQPATTPPPAQIGTTYARGATQAPPTGAAETPEAGARYYRVPDTNEVRTVGPDQWRAAEMAVYTQVPPSVARDAKNYGGIREVLTIPGVITTYTFQKEPEITRGLYEDYQTVTNVQVVVDANGRETRTTTVREERCGAGIADCDEKNRVWVADSVESATTQTRSDGSLEYEGRIGYQRDEQGRYLTSDGEFIPVAERRTLYDPPDKPGDPQQFDGVVVYGRDGEQLYRVNSDGEITDPLTDEELKGYYAAQKAEVANQVDRANVAAVSHGIGYWDATMRLGFWRSLGRFMRSYDKYSGLRQYSGLGFDRYDEEVQRRRQNMQQEFCIFAGLSNCVASRICGEYYEIDADEIPVIAGRGPGGQFVTSATLNAERSIPVEVAGLTRQQLIDLLGNVTVIQGKPINLTRPEFDPRSLGQLKLRWYHVQYSVVNNARSERHLRLNIIFKIMPANFIPTQSSCYEDAIRQLNWYPENLRIDYQATQTEDLYKFSATQYDCACLSFDPSLPTGHAAGEPTRDARRSDRLCVPITEYLGGPTDAGAAPGQVLPAATTAPGGQI